MFEYNKTVVQQSLIARSITIPGFFTISKGSITNINEILTREGIELSKSIIVSGKGFTESVGNRIENSINGDSLRIRINDNATDTITAVENVIRNYNPSLVIGIGGGKVLDVTKYCAHKMDKSFLAIPTTLSNDGISSPIAVVQNDHEICSIGTNPPVGIIIDIDIINTAPKETILAGIGDLISNISAIDDWNLANKLVGEKVDRFAEILAKNSTEGFIQVLNRIDTTSSILEEEHTLESLAEGLIQSGVAMSLAGSSRPCSGSEHLISHALDRLLNPPKSHGLQVGLATLFTSSLRGKDISNLINLFKKIGFPLSPSDIRISLPTFLKAVEYAPATRTERFTILNTVSEQEIKTAIKMAYGGERT